VNPQEVSETESAAILAVLAGSIAAIAIVMSFQARTQNLETLRRIIG
jgi:hypothetical protein